ncbi:MAG: T9SS type A sorting domain-containing protein [Bacteroidia bacterium]|nr:T9SS type A sorting domain-containing protein [Bacteroidia bacterium]
MIYTYKLKATSRKIGLLSLLFVMGLFQTKGQQLDWVLHFGGYTSDGSESFSIEQIDDQYFDSEGNLYLLGRFGNRVDFDPSDEKEVRIHDISSSSNVFAMFLAKYSPNQELLWVKVVQNKDGSVFSRRMKVSEEDNAIVVSGYFWDPVDFDPESTVSWVNGNHNVGLGNTFLCRYTLEGKLVWAENISRGSSANSISIELTQDDQILVHQSLTAQGDIDPDPEESELVRMNIANVNERQYLAWYSLTDGSLTNSVIFDCGGTGNQARALALDDDGNIFIAGIFHAHSGQDSVGFIDLDPSEDSAIVKQLYTRQDGFVGCYDKDGNYKWHKRIKTNFMVSPNAMTFTDTGTLVVVGEFGGTAIFGTGGITHDGWVAGGRTDAFFAEYRVSDGKYIRSFDIARGFDDQNNDQASVRHVSIDKSGNLYLAGDFTGTRDFGPQNDNEILGYWHRAEPNGNEKPMDMFIIKYDPEFKVTFLETIGGHGGGHDHFSGGMVLRENDEKLIVSGRFTDTVNFGLANNVHKLKSLGMEDAFIVQYDVGSFVSVRNTAQNEIVANVFPNPTQDVLRINIQSDEDISRYSIELVDVKGSHVDVPIRLSQQGFEVQVGHLPAGTYYCTLKEGKRRSTYQLLKH